MTTRQHVLIVDDDPSIHACVRAVVRPLGAKVFMAKTAASGLQTARQDEIDLILLDADLPDGTGYDLCQQLRADAATADLPIIFLTAAEDTDAKVRAFNCGASDYIIKPFDVRELRARVRAALRTQSLVDQLEMQASTDALTGLANRKAFHAALAREIDRARDHNGYGFIVMFLDLDRFKVINDSLSHDVGDQLLVFVGRALKTLVEQEVAAHGQGVRGCVARLGGDEFTILLSNVTDEAFVRRVADGVLARLGEPVMIQGFSLFTGASVGVRFCQGADLVLADVMRDADAAMYHAKTAGRGRYAVFDSAMHAQLIERLGLEQDLREAASRGELELHYQPIVNLDSGRLEALEALLRWNHPRLGQIAPGQFIPLAEESELILQIGSWVLREACEFAMKLDGSFAAGERPPRICVNISRRQLSWPGFRADVRRILAETRVRPAQLEFEITESTIMHDLRLIVPMLHDLSACGIRLAVDDFGTGHSSLATLPQFPLNTIKIDRSFVARMGAGRAETAIINAVVSLAYHLGLEVIGEGVESAEQLVQLQSIGCSMAQGYLLGRPIPAAQVLAQLPPQFSRQIAPADGPA